MEQVATDAVKAYPVLAIPLIATVIIVYWFLQYLRWREQIQKEKDEQLQIAFSKNAEVINKNTEMFGRVGAALDRLEPRGAKP